MKPKKCMQPENFSQKGLWIGKTDKSNKGAFLEENMLEAEKDV